MKQLLFRASQMPRAINCLGSVPMEAIIPPAPDTDESREGTAAHEVAEMILNGVVSSSEELIDRQTSNKVMIDADMVQHVDTYVDHLHSRNLPIYVELPVKFTVGQYATIDGTSDAVTIDHDNGIIYVDDFKYGWRLVDADGNWQTFSYGVGVLEMIATHFPETYTNIKQFALTIHQPRPHHQAGPIRTEWITKAEMNERFEFFTSQLKKISEPNPPLMTGSHCHYCTAFHCCPAAQAAGMNAVDVAGKPIPDHLDNAALSSEYRTLLRAKTMLANREAVIMDMMIDRIKQGNNFSDWGLEKSYGHSAWVKGTRVETLEMIAGQSLSNSKMVTPAEAKRRGVAEETIKAFTHRPFKGHKLVQIDLDKQAKGKFGK